MTRDELRAIHSARVLPFEEGCDVLRSAAGWLLPEAVALRVTGTDRNEWLQGQVTNDVAQLMQGQHCRCCVLTATGQVIADCQLIALDDSYVLIADGPVRDRLLSRLESTIILEDVVLEEIDAPIVHAAGPKASGEMPNSRLKRGGYDSIGVVPEDAVPVSEESWTRARIEDGYPLCGTDMDEKTLAMEMGPEFVRSRISFSKGCYTGQEIVERISARGHTNRQWVRLESAMPIAVGDAIEGGGRVTSASGTIAAGFVRHDAIGAGEVVISSAAGPTKAKVTEV